MTNIRNRLEGLEVEFSLRETGLTYRDIGRKIQEAGIRGVKCIPDASAGVDGEVVFPPLPYNQFAIDYIKSVIDLLVSNGATINSGCGMHVHISNAKIKDGINPITLAGPVSYTHLTLPTKRIV